MCSAGQSQVLKPPKFRAQSLHGTFTQHLDLLIPVVLFQLRIFCDFWELSMYSKKEFKVEIKRLYSPINITFSNASVFYVIQIKEKLLGNRNYT